MYAFKQQLMELRIEKQDLPVSGEDLVLFQRFV
jgi:hypothetical protein